MGGQAKDLEIWNSGKANIAFENNLTFYIFYESLVFSYTMSTANISVQQFLCSPHKYQMAAHLFIDDCTTSC